ncbi:PAQR family membrane homeostasis protein TrhA [Methylobacterium nodulans]|uniref:Hly-III family protein n=1 Tax=Methylobacterium nodulans (strain LMG 21967 / CNCM I-2342 / ORS 2060) TaxID=460265 RepID=B8ISP1_METNO|nr:hemolysin III family protein [Methylobacterium nodulans]ACL60690.1 Hly-III family protein [Methylobacterium nodulans ORS 2060]
MRTTTGHADAPADDGRPPSLHWAYTPRELLADGIVHVLGVALAVIGALALVVTALLIRLDASGRVSVGIYATGLVAMLSVSAVYNMWPVGRLKWLLRRADHATIFLMIAGTYTPLVTLVGAGGLAWGLLAGIWLFAVAGVAIKLALPGRFDRLAVGLYLALGWSGVTAYDSVIGLLAPEALALLAAGGLLYSAGVVFHLWQRLPFQNAIWHGFVLAAAACHYGAVFHSMIEAAA